MAAYKMTFFFEQLVQANQQTASSAVGWTESWYMDEAGIGTLDAALMSNMVSRWLDYRRACLPATYRIWLIRAIEVTTGVKNGRAKLRMVNMPGQTAAGPTTTVAQVNCALLVDIVKLPSIAAEKAHHRRLLLRGLTGQDMAATGNVWNRGGGQSQAILAFLNHVARGEVGSTPPAGVFAGWKIRYQDPTVQAQPLTNLIVDANNLYQISVQSPALAGAIVGDKVLLKGVTFPLGCNRIWTVKTLPTGGDPNWHLAKSRKRLSGAWDAGSGSATLVRYVYGPPDEYLPIGLRNKKTGGVFRLARGRARAR